jgi:hypothetical protein
MLARHLAKAGADFNTHALPFDYPNRHIPTMKPGKPGLDSERTRGVGGKTMLQVVIREGLKRPAKLSFSRAFC